MNNEFKKAFEEHLSKLIELEEKLRGLYFIDKISEYLNVTIEMREVMTEANKYYLLMTSDEKKLTYDWHTMWLTDKNEMEENWATYDIDGEENSDEQLALLKKEHPEYFDKNDDFTTEGWKEWDLKKEERMKKFINEIESIGGTVECSEVPIELTHFEFAYRF